MSKQKLIKDDLQYILFSEIYFRLESPKAKRKAFLLIEASIQCLAKRGFENFSLENAAREAGVSRATIRHYFEDSEDLRELTVKYIRLLFQKLAVDAMVKKATPDQMLSAYVDSCFIWVENFRTHANVWLSFLNFCTNKIKLRALNTDAVQAGHERLTALLANGKASGIFKHANSEVAAKMIQVFITGAMVVSASEDFANRSEFVRDVRAHCLALAGAG
jgi:AcrR family transcriptional regulator